MLYYYYLILGEFSYVIVFLLGLILGSFLNSWLWRLRDNVRILTLSGRSVCVHCHRVLRWYENIPLVSFIFLKAKCRTCQRPIPWCYPLVEFFTAASLTLIAWHHVNFLPTFYFWHFFRDVFFVTFLIVIFVFDARYQLILSRIVWPAAILGFIFNYWYLGFSVKNMALAAALAGGFFLLQYLISRGRWLGGGDVRLGIMMGIWLGWPNVLVAMLFAYLAGAAVALIILALKKGNLKTAMPFGVFLALGTLLAMYYGNEVVSWYLGLIK